MGKGDVIVRYQGMVDMLNDDRLMWISCLRWRICILVYDSVCICKCGEMT